MNQPEADTFLEQACRRGILGEILKEYIAFCHSPADPPYAEKKSRATVRVERFPNLAGFCRYLGCSMDEWLSMEQQHPDAFGRLRAVLEDEALNAAMSPTVIAAYLKRRLGYEKDAEENEGTVAIQFEHDILEDGE